MRRARTARALGAAACAAALLGACSLRSGSRRGGAAQAPETLRVWVAPILRWEVGVARAVELALENATDRTVSIAAPDPAHARVAVFERPDGAQVCGVEPSAEPVAGDPVELAPGDRVAVRVDLAEACGALPPGEYRYEVSYRAPEAARGDGPAAGGRGGPLPFSGTVATTYGEVLVEGGSAERGEGPARAARRPPRAR